MHKYIRQRILILPFIILLILPLFINAQRKNTSFLEKKAALEERAEKDDPAALYHLSTLYFHGYDSIAADSLRALSLLKRSAALGYAPAQNELGFLLYAAQPDSALFWLRKAADKEDPKALNNLAYIILLRYPSDADSLRLAAGYLKKAADKGLPSAMASLADLYREGRGVEKDTLTARRLYLRATAAGLTDAELKLLSMDAPGYAGLSPDSALNEGIRAALSGAPVAAYNLYTRAAEGDIPRAFALLADASAGAKGTDYDNARARALYLRAARKGDPSARFIVAELLEIFPDVYNDSISGEMRTPQYWYDLAAADSVTDAREAMRRLFALPSSPSPQSGK